MKNFTRFCSFLLLLSYSVAGQAWRRTSHFRLFRGRVLSDQSPCRLHHFPRTGANERRTLLSTSTIYSEPPVLTRVHIGVNGYAGY